MPAQDCIGWLFTPREPGMGLAAAGQSSMPPNEAVDMGSRPKELHSDTVQELPGNGIETGHELSREGSETVKEPSKNGLQTVLKEFQKGSERVSRPLEDHTDAVSAAGQDAAIEQEAEPGSPLKSMPVPYQQIADLYNSICVSLPKVKTLISSPC
jgi:hypothetical protein